MVLILGVAVGLILGLTGAGGSILAVPLLMGALGWSLTQAAPVALMAVSASAALGAYTAWRRSYVRYRAAALMAMAGLLTAPLGIRAADAVPDAPLTVIFAAVLALVAVRMFVQAERHPDEATIVRATVHGDGSRAQGPVCRLNPATGRIRWTRPCAMVISGVGAVTGFFTGLLGVGGGFIIVPSLRAATELSMHSAVATSLMAIALTSGGSVVAAGLSGRELPWMVALPFVAGALAGMGGGRWLAPRIAGARLQEGFAVLMGAVALAMAGRGFDLY